MAFEIPGSEGEEGQHQREEQPVTLGDEFDWRTKFRTDVIARAEKWAEMLSVDKFAIDAFIRDNFDGAISFIEGRLNDRHGVGRIEGGQRHTDNLSAESFQRIWEDGLYYMSIQLGVDLTGEVSKSGSGRRGSGPSGPSAQDIRNMFDEDELTENVEKMWGAYLVEDAPNARAIAKGYIDTVVATRGEQELDFQTYVLGKIRETNRHKLVYRNKPEGMDELQYIQPYSQAAQAVVGGGQDAGNTANAIAASGAAFGANTASFGSRLARTKENQQSQGFIGELEDTVRGVKNILRG